MEEIDIRDNTLRKYFYIILFDAPPISIVSNSMLLYNKANYVLIVNRIPYKKMKEYSKGYSNYSNS